MPLTLSVIVPVYNEAKTIRDLIRQVWPDQQQEAVRASLTAAVAVAFNRYSAK